MVVWIGLILSFVIGGFIGSCLIWFKVRRGLAEIATAQAIAAERKRILDERELELAGLRQNAMSLEKIKTALETEKNALLSAKKQQEENSEKISRNLLLEFEGLAHKILDEKSKKFDESSRKELLNIINPLKENIKIFQENVNRKHETDIQDRASLKKEIQFITQSGKELKESSDSLTKALRGDSKTQGKWGELILEKILENSGLKKGVEFSVQTSYQNDERGLQRPDVTLHLSNQKQLFIDSKVSLSHYDRYINAENASEETISLDSLENAFIARIKELGEKNYPAIQGITTLDFVIMFSPIESAFSLVAQRYEEKKKKTLFEFGWERGVIVATPLTLMSILKTINVCWQVEYQNKNALAIAEEADRLYDKFVTFVGKFEKIQLAIERSQTAFNEAKNTLVGQRSLSRGFDKIRQRLRKEQKLSNEYIEDDGFLEDSEAFIEEEAIDQLPF